MPPHCNASDEKDNGDVPTGRHLPVLPVRVGRPPAQRPVLLFDGDCGFCRRWAARGTRWLAGRVDFQPWQAAADSYPEIPRTAFEHGVQFITPDGRVRSNAAAALHALATRPRWGWVADAYNRVPGVAPLAESLYRLVANHRPFFARLDQRLTGTRNPPPDP